MEVSINNHVLVVSLVTYCAKLPESDWLMALQLTQICTDEIHTKHAIAI